LIFRWARYLDRMGYYRFREQVFFSSREPFVCEVMARIVHPQKLAVKKKLPSRQPTAGPTSRGVIPLEVCSCPIFAGFSKGGVAARSADLTARGSRVLSLYGRGKAAGRTARKEREKWGTQGSICLF
jgi:hypothetical protein